MASLSLIRTGLAARLATITTLNTYASAPGQVVVPGAIVLPGQIVFDETMGRGSDLYTFEILLLVGKPTDALAQEHLDLYLAGSGSSSVKAAVEGDGGLGGAADWSVVKGVTRYGEVDYNGTQYLGARLAVEVNVDGT